MGWGRTLFLGDIGNRLDIEDVEKDISTLRNEIGSAFRRDMSQDETIRKLVAENAELKLYLASLVRLLTRNGTISRDELAAVVDAIDAEDGQADGRYEGKVL
jgi:hypothetical protein